MSERDTEAFTPGEVVYDRDDDDPNAGIVVNLPPVPATEWDVHPLDSMLAEANPDYPDDAQTVIVVFREALAEYLSMTDTARDIELPISLADLADEHVPFYAFPAPRLAPTGEQYTHGARTCGRERE